MRPWPLVAALLALAAIGFLFVETHRLAELAGRFEVEARAARAAAAAADARLGTGAVQPAGTQTPDAAAAAPPASPPPTASPPPAASAPPPAAVPAAAPTAGPAAAPAAAPTAVPAADALAYSRLALELATTQEQLRAVTALLEERNREAAARAAATSAAAARLDQPMPGGVRDCLIALHELLRAEGFFGARFLHATALGPEGLLGVELLDADPAGIDVAVITAQRMTATVDRGKGRLELRFFAGERALRGERTPLPEDGWLLAFDDVDARAVEARLPYLVRAEGVHPEPPAAVDQRHMLDPILRRQWLERFDRLLAAAGTQPAWRVNRLRGLRDGWFLVGELVGTDERHHVVAGAHCARFAVEIDRTANVVSLLLRDGSLRRGTVESSISGEGFRVPLPDLTCERASDLMLGMVVTR